MTYSWFWYDKWGRTVKISTENFQTYKECFENEIKFRSMVSQNYLKQYAPLNLFIFETSFPHFLPPDAHFLLLPDAHFLLLHRGEGK